MASFTVCNEGRAMVFVAGPPSTIGVVGLSSSFSSRSTAQNILQSSQYPSGGAPKLVLAVFVARFHMEDVRIPLPKCKPHNCHGA